MTNISGNPREQVKKKITEIFQSVIIDASRYEGEDRDKYFNVKMDEAYENVLRDKKLMDECGLDYVEYRSFVSKIATDNVSEAIRIIERQSPQRPPRDAWGCTKYIFTLFILSIGFCWAVCDIDTEKTYTWYAGIWHGLFFVQHLICGLFSDNVYKACHFTSAYNTWWWITVIVNTPIMTLWTIGGVIYDMGFLKKRKISTSIDNRFIRKQV